MKEHYKVAKDANGADRLRREADLLGVARHPGVVELLRLDDGASSATLVTVRVDGRSLAQVGSLRPQDLAGLGIALATILADLHDLGLVHGSVTLDHVIVRHDGRPVLCGFADGGRTAQLVPGRSLTLEPQVDVEALGRVLRHFAVGPSARVVRRIAQAATHPAPGAPLTARALAAELEAAVPDARLPSNLANVDGSSSSALAAVEPAGRLPRSRRSGRRGATGAAAAVGMLVVVGAGLALNTSGGARPTVNQGRSATSGAVAPSTSVPSTSATSTTAVAIAATTIAKTAPVASPTCGRAVALLVADVDGDGCDEVLTYTDGLLSAGDVRWQMGRPGDIVVAGDWSCTRRRTLALLRPDTGQVFRFDSWAATGGDITAEQVGTVAGGRALRAADVDGDGCHELVVERFDGSTEVVRPLPLAP